MQYGWSPADTVLHLGSVSAIRVRCADVIDVLFGTGIPLTFAPDVCEFVAFSETKSLSWSGFGFSG